MIDEVAHSGDGSNISGLDPQAGAEPDPGSAHQDEGDKAMMRTVPNLPAPFAMIVLNLLCRHDHRFEGWFASVDVFERQQQDGMVACPVCNSDEVSRLPSGPRVISSGRDVAAGESQAAVQAELLEALKAHVRDSENVGQRFPEEARKIHYREAPARNIRGVASLDETKDLLDEGIFVLPLPVPPSDETH